MPRRPPAVADAAATMATWAAAPTPPPPPPPLLDHRWHRRRGVIFASAEPATPPPPPPPPSHPRPHAAHISRRLRLGPWAPANAITFAPTPAPAPATPAPLAPAPATTRHASNPLARRSAPARRAPAAPSAAEVPHTLDFGASSPRDAGKLQAEVTGLKEELAAEGVRRSQLAAHSAAQSGTIAALRRDADQLRRTLAQATAEHQRQMKAAQAQAQQTADRLTQQRQTEVEQLHRHMHLVQDTGAREKSALAAEHAQAMASERSAHSRVLSQQQARHEAQMDQLRTLSSPALARNKPILDAARKEGEDKARAAERKYAKLLAHVERERLQYRGELARLASEARDGRERANEAIWVKDELQKLVDGRTARAEADRSEYQDYQGLYLDLKRLGLELGHDLHGIRAALQRESVLWHGASERFLTAPCLAVFRHLSDRYGGIQQSISAFLHHRARQAQAASGCAKDAAAEIKSQIMDMQADAHFSRLLTRLLHFAHEHSPIEAVQAARHLRGIEPLVQRRIALEAEMHGLRQKLDGSSDHQDLLEKLLQAQKQRDVIDLSVKYFRAVSETEQLKVKLNYSLPEKRVEIKTSRLRERLSEVSKEFIRATELGHARRSSLALRSTRRTLQRQLSDNVRMLQQMTMYEEHLGRGDREAEREFDRNVRIQLAAARTREERCIESICGARTESAVLTRRQRMRPSASSGATVVSDLSADRAQNTAFSPITKHPVKSKLRLPHSKRHRDADPKLFLSRSKRTRLEQSKARDEGKATGADAALANYNTDKARTAIGEVKGVRMGSPKPTNIEESRREGRSSPAGDRTRTARIGTEITFGRRERPARDTPHTPPSTDPEDTVASYRPVGSKGEEPTKLRAPVAIRRARVLRGRPQQPSPSDLRSSLGKSSTKGGGRNVEFIPSRRALSQPWPFEMHGRSFSSASHRWHRHLRWSTLSPARCPAATVDATVDATGSGTRAEPQQTVTATDPATRGNQPKAAKSDGSQPADETGPETSGEPQTILEYQIPAKDYRDAVTASPNSAAAFWSHGLYKSKQGTKPLTLYCRTLEKAEAQLKTFLDEPVLGFDLEWEQNVGADRASIKKNVSLIQIAAEDRIALVQLAAFKGESAEELLPPSLRTILEDEKIVKAGVNVGGDATRMRKFLGVHMRGLFELSHLYRLVKKPDEVNFRLVSLTEQVQNVLLLPLLKNDIRVSAWSRRLNTEQTAYAAADAYAGFRLYHKLDNDRKLMVPTPPRPAYYETGQPIVLGDGRIIERSKDRSKVAVKKTASGEAVAAGDGEEDDVFFDAVEDLPADTYDVHVLRVKPGSASTPAAAPDEHPDVVHTAVYPALAPPAPQPPNTHSPTSAPRSDAQPSSVTTPARPKPKPLENAFTALADEWIASHPPTRVGTPSVRAYHLWHHQNLSLPEVASLCRDPPLAPTTVASYITQAVTQEGLAYEKARMRAVLEVLPRAVWPYYGNVVRDLGL